MPHLQMYTGYTYDADPTGDGNYFLLGIGATLPVYSWKKKQYQMHEIDFSADAIHSQAKTTERDLTIRFEQIAEQIRQLKNVMDFQDVKLHNDQDASKMAELNYRAGLASNLDFLNAAQKLTETRLNSNTVYYQYLKSLIVFWLLTNQVEKIKNIN